VQRNWTEVGRHFCNRGEVESAISSAKWVEARGSFPFMQGEGIKTAIQQLGIPKVSHIALSVVDSCGLYGIRGHYTNGTAEVWVLDRGTELVPVCSDFEAN